MSLEIVLTNPEGEEVYVRNLSPYLRKMVEAAGLYDVLWRPQESGYIRAAQLIAPLSTGVVLLATNKGRFQEFNVEDGYGSYEDLLVFCADYLQACSDHPNALIRVNP